MILNKNQGATLLEVLLVIAIAAVVILLGTRAYISYRNDVALLQIRNNVDILFQGLNNYYRANCIAYMRTTTARLKSGTLDPSSSPENPFPININQLKTQGYVLTWPFPTNQYVSGYRAQFNLTTLDRSVQISFPRTMTTSVGVNQIWKAQVAVKIKDTANAEMYRARLGADCTSALVGSIVTPCATAAGGPYLVWERLPSLSSPDSMTDLWLSLPNVEQFSQMYTTYPVYNIISGLIATQYYLCGG